MRYRLACLALLAMCLVVACACTDSKPLAGTSWTLTQLRVHGVRQTLVPTAQITLHFDQHEDTYLGSSGCNYYDGAYTVSDSQIHLRYRDITARACVGPAMSQEVTYLNALQRVQSYQRDGQTLTLTGENGTTALIFTRAHR